MKKTQMTLVYPFSKPVSIKAIGNNANDCVCVYI